MTSTPASAMLARVQLTPLRAFHIDQGQGRTVAVLFRVAVDDHRRPADCADQRSGDDQAKHAVSEPLT
ncbi:MAG: hypothetical protein JSS57_22605 [Proteobacteria bacterium]|nr:hypothetical protein [Pseudomonadota bacterium]